MTKVVRGYSRVLRAGLIEASAENFAGASAPSTAVDLPASDGSAPTFNAPRCQRKKIAMTNPTNTLLPRYLRMPEAARFLSLSGGTLEKHRTYSMGPLYRKFGGRMVYAITDLQAWVESGTKNSTSDPASARLSSPLE